MKMMSKRILAFALTVCMLFSVLPPVVLAAGEGTGSQTEEKVVYDFQLEKTDLKTTAGGSFAKAELSSAVNSGRIAELYSAGTLNWKFLCNNEAYFETDGGSATPVSDFGGNGYVWSGLRVGMKVNKNSTNSYPVDHWIALTIRVARDGQYDLKLNHMLRSGGAKAGEVYIFPGESDYNAIQTAIGNSTAVSLGTVNYHGTNRNEPEAVYQELQGVSLTAGEHIVVFRATQSGNFNEAYMYLRSLELQWKGELNVPQVNKVTYDFSQTHTTEKTDNNFLNHYFYSNKLPDAKIDAAYENGALNWRIAGHNLTSLATGNYTFVDSYLGFSNNTWRGLRLAARAKKTDNSQEYTANHWFAFNLASPGAGTYEAVLNYQTRKEGNQDVKVYLLEGALKDPVAIQAAMDAATSLTTGFDSRKDNAGNVSNSTTVYVDASVSLGELTLKDSEYTLVIHSAGSGTYFFLDSVELTEKTASEETTAPTTATEETTGPEETTVPEETTGPVQLPVMGHSFEIGGVAELVNGNGTALAGKNMLDAVNQNALTDWYDNGVISWKYQMDNLAKFKTETNTVSNTYYFGGNNTYKYDGLRLGVKVVDGGTSAYPAGYWTAFTIKAPGTGNYKMSVGYQTRKDGSSAGEVYIVKGVFTDAAALEAAMNAHSLRAVVDFSSGSADFSAKQTQDLGIMAMEAGEYTLVFRAKTGSAAGAYMHVNGLTFEATDAPAYTPELPEGSLPAELVPQGYTFAIGSSPLTNTYGATMAGTLLTNPENLKALEKYYADGYISWKYLMDNLDNYKTQTNKVNSTFYIGGNNSYKYTGLRLGVLVIDGETRSYPAGHWTAFTMKSPGAGRYKMELGYQTRNDSTSAGEVYIIKGNITDKAALEAAMTADNLRQVVDFTGDKEFSDVQKIDLGIMEFAAGEYTLVFRAKSGSAAGAYMHIDGLTFTATNDAAYRPELPTGAVTGEAKPIGYSFELGTSNLTNIYDASMGGSLLINKENLQALEKYYAAGYISWKYAADNLASFQTATNKVSNTCYIGDGVKYKWNGLRLGLMVRENEENSYPYGHWTAFTIKSPGKGMGYLTLDYQTRADGTQEAEIYIIKGALTDPAQIEAQLVESNKLNFVDMKGASFTVMKDKSKYLGAVDFEEGEYTIVFKAAMDSGNKAAYMFIDELHIKDTAPPAPTEFVFDFDLNNQEEGIYKGKAQLKDKISDIQARYEKGKLNWMYYGKDVGLSDEGHRFNWRDGLGIYTMEGNWMAFKIKSPGPGLYTFILNHAISGNGALGAIYVLPANTPVSQIPTAMDHSNRVGKVEFYNDTGTTPVVGGATSTVGAFELGSADEYVIVFEAYDNTPYKNNFAYMWLTQLILKKGDYTAETVVGQRKIKPIVVDEGACRTMEPTIYLTTGEVNGQDYLFMPTEGKKMYVFNLEDMVKVREVTIPFNTCRGIGTDKDGMIWLVGDTSLVHRYDPYTNTGMTTYNYKLSGGIDNSTTAFDMEFDDQGNVYFGTFSMGYVVKYDPQADKFSKVGGDINPDAGYSCGIEVKDGYLYAAVSGDRNSDGVKIAEVVKIDLATDKIVSRVDIKEQFGDKEVMVRGAGICGNTLFMGGASMEGFVALDINTMELKDYGMTKQISYAPTEEIDGKCYMVVSGYGVYQYDSATDTLTKIPGMDTATIGFRAQKHSSITLSNNPLFPGTSYITNTGTGLKIYNMETKQVFTPHLYDEKKDGSGQIIRTIVRGEEGDENIYVGGFNTINCAQINTITGERTIFEATSAQTDVMLWHEGALYVGNYNAGNVVRINFEDPEKNVILLTMKSLYNQARVHALAAGDDYLFAGSIPDAFLYGGCLAIINLKTQERIVEENLIPGQCVTSLAYNDGIVFGGTSTAGGTGAQGSATGTESAVIFAYDVEKKEKVAELDLREIFPGLPSQLQHIDGLIEDPDIENNGKFWGMISETLFTFTFDKETNTFKVKEELSFGYDKVITNRSTDDCNFAFDGNGYLYVAFGEQGGMRKVNMANPKDNERINMETPKTFALGPDGNLYYSCANAILKMFPLNITEADWVEAEAVDKLILDIGKKITLDSEEKIVAARAAYDALDLKHKSLVQFLEILEIAETDLLECKIDAIGEVTLDKRAEIEAILAAYNALTAIQQKYVKNYSLLNEADLALQGLINAQVAAEMQKIIDAMKDAASITLDDYDYVMGIKAQYDALKFLQRQLVDATKLEAALAKITELRQEKIEHLKKLIASIGEVTLEDEPIIVEAVAIFDWLTLDERNQVDYITLNAAEKALKKLQKAAAEEVDALIEAIGEVKRSSGKAIEAARAAYDALTEGSKAYVKLLDTLLAAEAAYAEFGGLGVVGTIAVVVAVLAAGGIGVTLVVVKKPNLLKKKAKAEETAE